MKILIVDDNDICLTILEQTLTASGYEVVRARDGAEALALARDAELRMIISDWEMPGMSGTELCSAIRHSDYRAYTYFILVTSHNSAEERVRGLASGADDFIAKPFNPAELVERVRCGERILALETRDVAIFALAKLAESRDSDTGAHLERVQSYSRTLAQSLAGVEDFAAEIDGEFIRLIHQTSPLHDIGKVGIPDRVLLKPGRFSEAEYEVMKSHTLIGASTLDAALARFPGVKFLSMARDIALHHHERWDGRGYPRGLAGDAIPLSARIVSLADVYDALTSRRVYKEAFGHEQAKRMIAGDQGARFDPRVVQAFLRSEASFQDILRRFREHDSLAA